MPRQGQSVESCIIIEWKVGEGDTVAEGQPICDIETDKAAFEVESPVSGTVLGIFYPVESDVEVLKVIAAIGDPGEDISALRPSDEDSAAEEEQGGGQAEEERAETTPGTETEISQIAGSSAGASPRAKRLAASNNMDISRLAGTGPNGRVIVRDVAAAQTAAASEGPDFPGATTGFPLKGVRKLIAERMRASLQNSAQLTHNTSADARSVLGYRQKCKAAPEEAGVGGISINDIVLYATVRTLAEFPELNAHCLDDRIVQFENVHLGLAIDTPRGLIVPVIRHANLMNLKQLAVEARRLAAACMEGSVDPDVLRGGTFTVSNLGALGIESFTPVLNTPEVGILGVCAIQPKPVMNDGEVEFIQHMGLSLTFDHRAVDGAPAARFLASLREKLAAFEQTLAG
jgi:pyruvate dehydrogenase E2 component (dihydrolipoamide acetyltransferase)